MPPRHRQSPQRPLLTLPIHEKVLQFEPLAGRLWTESKARLIESYIKGFQIITKHGTYIDGFAAPQENARTDSWAAKRVLSLTPLWLRHFHLFDRPDRVSFLEDLRATHPNIDIRVYGGDVNKRIHEILREDVIANREATFCLLDQWTNECDWSTVRAIARHKSGQHKIEIFYFLAVGWLHRVLRASRTAEALQQIEAWYGGGNWDALAELSTFELAEHFQARFQQEFGYRFVIPWAIYERSDPDSRIMFYMIHASDHARAPKLMADAYAEVVVDVPKPDRRLPLRGFDCTNGS